jgi:hypothetical protein
MEKSYRMESASPPARRIALAALACLVACGPPSTQYRHDYDPGVDFAQLKTWNWAERTPSGDDDARVYNRVTMGRVRTAIERNLRAKEFTRTEVDPHFLVAWHGAIQGGMSAVAISGHYGYGWGWYGGGGTRTFVNEWDEGTLLVDIVDAPSNQLIWRGVAAGTIDETRTPQEAQAFLDRAVARILVSFPPASSDASEGG